MQRRVSLPGASELFRATHDGLSAFGMTAEDALPPTGRIRHEEKITVYVSTDELLALEQARIALRRDHRLAVDRGRIVREALALMMEDLAARGPESGLVQRLKTT